MILNVRHLLESRIIIEGQGRRMKGGDDEEIEWMMLDVALLVWFGFHK